MARSIVKIHDELRNKDYYMEWSSIVDAPVTYGMNLEEFKIHYKQRYGTEGMIGLPERLKRVEEYGTTENNTRVDEYYEFNRAGKNETCIGKEEILERYCRKHLA